MADRARWENGWLCTDCEAYLTMHQVTHSRSTCPYCGNQSNVDGSLASAHVSARPCAVEFVPGPRRWWLMGARYPKLVGSGKVRKFEARAKAAP